MLKLIKANKKTLFLSMVASLILYYFWPPKPVKIYPPVITQSKLKNTSAHVNAINKSGVNIPLTHEKWIFNPDKPDQKKFGKLTLNWAYSLHNDHNDFGGISGLSLKSLSADQYSFRSVTDAGHIFNLTINTPASNPLFSITNFRPVINRGEEKEDSDSEAVIVMPFGFDLVAYERSHRLMLGDIRLQNPPQLLSLPLNGGMEAVDMFPSSRQLIILTENAREDEDFHPLWISTQGLQEETVSVDYKEFRYHPPEGYSPTDVTALSSGAAIVLHRRWTPLDGMSAVISYLPADQLKKNRASLLTSTPLARLTNDLDLDNFEGIAAIEHADTIELFIVSDDNFRSAQNTVIASFSLLKSELTPNKPNP